MPNASDFLKTIKFSLKTLGLPMLLRSARYSIQKAHAELKFADPFHPHDGLGVWWQAIKASNAPLPAPPNFADLHTPGEIQSWREEGNTVLVVAEHGYIELTVLTPEIVRVRFNPDHSTFPAPFSYAILPSVADWTPPDITVSKDETALLITTAALTVRVHHANGFIDFLDAAGQPINLDSGGIGWNDEWQSVRRALPPFAPVFGLGEHATPLNLRGHAFHVWARDPGGHYRTATDPLYQAHPWWVSLNQNRAFGIFWDNSRLAHLDLGAAQPHAATISGNGGELRYYFIFGPHLRDVLARFSDLTGKMPLPPLWTLGFQQARWSYKSEEEVLTLAKEFRRRKIPCDAIYLDIHYMQDYRVFSWHKKRFPNPAEMIKTLRPDGFKIVTILDPGIKADRLNDTAEDGLKKDVFLKLPDETVFKGPVWPGDCYFPDFTNPKVRIWWGENLRQLVDDGVAGFWTDMNEPALFGYGDPTLPRTILHDFEGRFATHAEMHNVYGLQMARATHDAIGTLRPNRRPFVLSRSGFSGIQRYAAVWTADIESTWEHLALSLSMVLQLGLSGVPFSGVDIGGFFGTPTPELFARWMQLGAFFPLFRVHCADTFPRQEPWSFGEQVEDISRRAIELRYRLLPYFYTVLQQATTEGLPIVRPMLMEFQDDAHTHSLDDQFMLGSHLLVAPILTPNTEARSVYLPAGAEWVNFWNDERFSGGQSVSVSAKLTDPPPIFVRAGAIIPQWDLIQHTDQAATLPTVHLHFYVGSGESRLYEDDGKGKEYRRGRYKLTRFIARTGETGIRITTRIRGEYAPPYDTLTWHVHSPEPLAPAAIRADDITVTEWETTAHSIIFRTPVIQRLDIRR